MISAKLEDVSQVFYVGGKVLAEHQDVVDVHKSVRNIPKDLIHETLKCVPRVPEAERHD